jgi:outer membrane autotransporter protein
MLNSSLPRLTISVCIAFALATSLSACGGGGGSRPSSSTGTTVPPTAPPSSTPPPTSSPSPSASYPADNQLIPTGAQAAQQAGFTGAGVKIGVLDSGIDPSLTVFGNRVGFFQSYISGGSNTPNDTTGHGSTIMQVMAGSANSNFAGGVAPGATLDVAQVCDASDNCIAPQQAYTDLTNQGVKLFNQSFGSNAVTSPATSASGFAINSMAPEYQPLVDAGALFVWSAGNNGAANLNFEAGAPQYVPSLQKGWLAVVNVALDSNGNVTGLDSTSAACGAAAQWCLAAPGTEATIPDGTFSTGLSDGTSSAAAVVTGVAAQVSQAFPWMTGGNIQQTLLTTATPLGGSAPNSTYGWGMVNAAKAVDGPAAFAFGEFDANVGTYNSTFSNAISGSGSLSLSGTTGSLTLTAANTYSGGTTINSATLNLTGSLGSSVFIDSPGVLAGSGTVNGNITNAGTLTSQSTTAGQGLTITGNYLAQAGSTTAIAIGNPVTVKGAATLGGTLEVLAPPSTYTPSATTTFLTASSISGVFSGQTYGSSVFYQASVSYTPTTVQATITREAVAQSIPLPNPAVASVAQGIDAALNQADTWSQTNYAGHSTFLNTAADFLTARTQSTALTSVQSLDGEIYGTTGVVEAQQARFVDAALAQRQNGMVSGSPGVWVQTLAENGSLYQSGYASARYHADGVMVGGETWFADNFAAGVAVGRNQMDSSLSGLGGQTRGYDNTLGFYANLKLGDDGMYLSGRASWSAEHLSVNRTALIGGSQMPLSSSRTDNIGDAALELGKAFSVGGGYLTPYVSISDVRIDQAGFTEQGGNGFGLIGQGAVHNIPQGDAGLRFGHAFDWVGGHTDLTGYAAYRRVFSGENLGFTAALGGAPDATFTAQGQNVARNTGELGLSADTQINKSWDWYINVDAQNARGMSHNLSGNAGIRWHF